MIRLNFRADQPGLFIGILSGTSMDSIDAGLVEFRISQPEYFKLLSTIKVPFAKDLTVKLRKLITDHSYGKLATLGELDHKIGVAFAKVINKLLQKAGKTPTEIIAIGSHGQNIWHAPAKPYGTSLQLGDPNIIAARTNIPTIADFRRKDLAFGGQGAPLAPGLHAALFRSKMVTRAIINIGGISNVTILPKDVKLPVLGFDLGPGNCLMDEWVQEKFTNLNLSYDYNGNLAAQGKVLPEVLKVCLQDPYFSKPAPKSTGREYFDQRWWHKQILAAKQITGRKVYRNLDLLTTLLHLTATAIRQQLLELPYKDLGEIEPIEEVYICGGGAKNSQLIKLLTAILPFPVAGTGKLGLNAAWVEAVLFAWLAKQTVCEWPGNLPTVTGAKLATVLGGIYLP